MAKFRIEIETDSVEFRAIEDAGRELAEQLDRDGTRYAVTVLGGGGRDVLAAWSNSEDQDA